MSINPSLASYSVHMASERTPHSDDGKINSVVHLLPCDIEFNGSAPVNSYFQTNSKDGEAVAHFRGRLLVEKRIALPEGVTGVHCVQDTRKSVNEVNWEVAGTFKEFHLWQHDVVPDLNQMNEIIDWFQCANEVWCL